MPNKTKMTSLAEEKTHIALAQLSVSRAGCKNESARVAGRLTHSLPLARLTSCPSVSLASLQLRCVKRHPVPVAQAPLQRD